jgi:DNA-binding MarR family transcriptional regulator
MTKKRQTKAELMAALGQAFRESQNRAQAFDELAAERLGINLTDLRCMDLIEQHGGLTAGELAEAAHLTTGAVTAVLDRLERAGYARRVRDRVDRRRVRAHLTAKAEEAAGAIWGPIAEESPSLLDRYTTEEISLVLDVMRRSAEFQDRHIERLKSQR